MKKCEPITRGLVAQWHLSKKETIKLEEEILDRIDYILNTWFNIYGAKLDYWYFDGAEEGEVGDMSRYFDDDSISGFYTEVENYPDGDMAFIDKEGDEYSWQSEIPTRWLFEEGFAEEITKGKAEYERLEAERKANKKKKAAAKKEKDALLAAQAKAKLSKEELAALKRDL